MGVHMSNSRYLVSFPPRENRVLSLESKQQCLFIQPGLTSHSGSLFITQQHVREAQLVSWCTAQAAGILSQLFVLHFTKSSTRADMGAESMSPWMHLSHTHKLATCPPDDLHDHQKDTEMLAVSART